MYCHIIILFSYICEDVGIISSAVFLAHSNPVFHANDFLKVTDFYHYFVGILMYQLDKADES